MIRQISISDLRAIADQYGVPVRFAGVDWEVLTPEERKIWINASCCMLDESSIEIGLYDDNELMAISFFHELAHVLHDHMLPADSEDIEYEIDAWKIGISIAAGHGISFSTKAISWALDQMKTYTPKGMMAEIDKYAEEKIGKPISQ